jgi:inositol-polyphosphate multikinase
MAPQKPQPDPSTFIAYSHAAAGHDGVRSDPTGTMLIKPCTPAEVTFYESAAAHPVFQQYMPTFMGTLNLNENQDLQNNTLTAPAPLIPDGEEKEAATAWVPSGGKKLDTGLSIVLENVTAGFKRPNVIDLKLGARLWDDDTPEAKRRKLDEVSNETTSKSLGFRIAGLKVYRPHQKTKPEARFAEHIEVGEDGYLSFNKFYGRGFNANDVQEAFAEFFGGEKTLKQPNRATCVVKRLRRDLKGLISLLENEESRMYSASILVVYEGDEEAIEAALEEERRRAENPVMDPGDDNEHDEESEEEDAAIKSKVHELRLIDFAHARWTPGQGPDENALQGLRGVLTILEQFVAEHDREKTISRVS